MTAGRGRDPQAHTVHEGPLRTPDTLPRAKFRDLARDRGRFYKPNGRRSRLWEGGERFLIDLPVGPKLIVTSSPQDAKAIFADRDGALSFGELLRRFTPHESLFGSDAFAWEQPRRFRDSQRSHDSIGGSGAARGRAVLDLMTIHVGQGGAPLDLMLQVADTDGEFICELEYNTDLFDDVTIARVADPSATSGAAGRVRRSPAMPRLVVGTDRGRRYCCRRYEGRHDLR